MARKKVSISITISRELNHYIEEFVKTYNMKNPDAKTSKSEFFEVACVWYIHETTSNQKDVEEKIPEDKGGNC